MAPKIEPTDIQTTGLVVPTSRYAGRPIVLWGDNRVMTYTTYRRHSFPESPNDRYWVITPGYEYRPDKAANKLYRDPNQWWKLLEANGMKDILEFRAGATIRIPPDGAV